MPCHKIEGDKHYERDLGAERLKDLRYGSKTHWVSGPETDDGERRGVPQEYKGATKVTKLVILID